MIYTESLVVKPKLKIKYLSFCSTDGKNGTRTKTFINSAAYNFNPTLQVSGCRSVCSKESRSPLNRQGSILQRSFTIPKLAAVYLKSHVLRALETD